MWIGESDVNKTVLFKLDVENWALSLLSCEDYSWNTPRIVRGKETFAEKLGKLPMFRISLLVV